MFLLNRILFTGTPMWAAGILLPILGLWLIYCSMWSQATARRMVFDKKTLFGAGYLAWLETNANILANVASIPRLRAFFCKKEESKDTKSQPKPDVDGKSAP